MNTRIAATLIVLLLAPLGVVAAVGCGGEERAKSAGPVPTANPDTTEETGTTTGTATSETTTETGTAPSPQETRRYQLWFSDGVTLYLAWREGPATEGVARQAVELLLEGPIPVEDELETAIPAGTRLLGIDIDEAVATVDLSSEFESGGGSQSMFMRLAQVVYTVTQFTTVRAVRFHLDGRPVDVFSGEGIVLDSPVTRKDYEQLLPPIVVESPAWFERVTSPIRISGTANVFEANVIVRLIGEHERELARTFTTATCGSGCRGTFELSLPVPRVGGSGERPLTILLSDDDADGDGRPAYEVGVPVLYVGR